MPDSNNKKVMPENVSKNCRFSKMYNFSILMKQGIHKFGPANMSLYQLIRKCLCIWVYKGSRYTKINMNIF